MILQKPIPVTEVKIILYYRSDIDNKFASVDRRLQDDILFLFLNSQGDPPFLCASLMRKR